MNSPHHKVVDLRIIELGTKFVQDSNVISQFSKTLGALGEPATFFARRKVNPSSRWHRRSHRSRSASEVWGPGQKNQIRSKFYLVR